jgi:hypothetical protein
MAISILTTPPLIAPVYNPIYIQVESDKTAQEAFNFIFDLYINGNFIVRDRLLPRPATIQAVYSPARILESYLSFDKSQNVTGSTASTNCIDYYEVVCGEEYINPWRFYDNSYSSIVGFTGYTEFYMTGSTSNPYVTGDKVYVVQDSGFTSNIYNGTFTVLTATSTSIVVDMLHTVATPVNGGLIYYSDRRKTIYTGTTGTTGYSWNGVVQYEEIPTYDYTDYMMVSNNIVYNGGFTSALNGWSIPSPLVDESFSIATNQAVYSGAFDTNNMTIINTGTTLISGQKYTVTIECVSTVSPYSGNSNLDARIYLGNVVSPIMNNVGLYQFDMVAGGDCLVKLKVGTDSQGGEMTFDNLSVYLNNSGKFLTNQPTVKTKLDERGSIGFMNIQPFISGATYYMFLAITRFDGSPTFPIPFPLLEMSGTTTNEKIIEFGAYPWNLNQASQSLYGIDAIDEYTSSYLLIILMQPDPIGAPDSYLEISERKTFEIDTDCSKYEPVRFMFLNALGQFDYFTATLLSRENINISKTSYQKTLPYNYQVGDRGKTVLSVAGQQSYIVTSNWITEDTCTWLMELFLSQEVYVLNNDGSLMPIIIDNTSVEPKKRVNDKLLNYTFNYTKAITKNTQRN